MASTPEDNLIVGIDLGTTFSLVAYADDRGAHVIRDDAGDGRVPSVIGFESSSEPSAAATGLSSGPGAAATGRTAAAAQSAESARGSTTGCDSKIQNPKSRIGAPRLTIGWDARRHAVENPRATIYSIKRLIGKGLAEVERELPFLAYAVSSGPRDSITVEIDGRRYTPQEISAAILANLKGRAEKYLGRPVTKAVITVPAYFDDAQRQATRDAGRIAGLEVVRIINEPTAAALAYGLGIHGAPSESRPEGRGPADARAPEFEPRPEARGFGRERESLGDDPSSPPSPVASASGSDQAPPRGNIPLPLPRCHEPAPGNAAIRNPQSAIRNEAQLAAVYDLGGGTFDVSILRIEHDVIQVASTVGDTHLGGDDFDREITTLVQREVRGLFGIAIDSPATKQALRTLSENVKIRLSERESAEIELDLGPQRLYRRTISRGEFESLIEPHVQRTLASCAQALRDAGLTADQIEQIVLVGGSTRIPFVRRRVQEFFGRIPYTALNPDEVVALGAAIQASTLSGRRRDMLLLDVTPLSLGIETMGGAMGKLIMRNTAIPCRATEQFTTFVDGQTAIKINVLQGERELAADCRSLGEFELRGIHPMPAGLPKVEVAFLIDANGILNVSAREQRSGVQAGIQVIPSHGLTREEVDRMARESIIHAQADIDAHRRIDLANQVTFDTHKAEQMLRLHGRLLTEPERRRIENDLAALRALAASPPADLNVLHEALDAFGKSTLGLAEIGIREALVKK